MASAMELDKIPDYLDSLRDDAPEDLVHYFLEFQDAWERKLWHELTNKLLEYFDQPGSKSTRLSLYNNFIRTFAEKINKLSLVSLGLVAALECEDKAEQLAMKKALADRVNKPDSQDAYVLARVAIAQAYLEDQDFAEARKILDECESILDTFDSVETVVHASFYRENADYFKGKYEYAPFYKNALLFLACVDIADLPVPEKRMRAYDLAIAALVSDSIYNFGELLLHPILDSLSGTEKSWVRDLLFAFNRGDLKAYDKLRPKIEGDGFLSQFQRDLYQKLALSALTETVFKRAPHDRTMTFAAISAETKIKSDEIEYMIMKALSLGLVRGSIDQVAEIARINWVQPKVLDKGQIMGMRTRLKEWDGSVHRLGTWIEQKGQDVWAA
ncbi:uncharacterized protein PV09_08547 [Verruconis gallopava]|uniref:PCI domain-containing protein n=1 Tax=Verruconis gallopava TaxID=253628 RepID=A0A0D2ALD5_9PEZI|nr:uncharacterized protein PV09_08547 [Verruconis gallopava]KIV99883.1 hypothetical protein PV09_08547 [Verruconis gallopava]